MIYLNGKAILILKKNLEYLKMKLIVQILNKEVLYMLFLEAILTLSNYGQLFYQFFPYEEINKESI